MGVFQNYGYLFGGPHSKDYGILGSILGSPYFGKLPHVSGLKVWGLGFRVWCLVFRVQALGFRRLRV